MSSKTKIFVVHMKEIIYTTIFVVLGILLILLLIFMFYPKNKTVHSSSGKYIPGTYTSSFTLNSTDFQVDVTVSEHEILSIQCNHPDDSVLTMYPLLQPAVNEISDQVCKEQSVKNIAIPKENPYTSQMILSAIEDALEKASAR